jgi:glycine cleavage system transcriptional repressor
MMFDAVRSSKMNVNNQHFLVATLLGNNQIGLLEAFTKMGKQCGCNILESKLSSVGEECALIFHYVGSWDAVAKLEIMLPTLSQQLGLTLQMKRTFTRSLEPQTLPYQIHVTAHDRVGILNELAFFFLQNRISVDKMECETYNSRNNSKLANIMFLVNIPVKRSLPDLRERFMTYCDERNLDAIIEPFR